MHRPKKEYLHTAKVYNYKGPPFPHPRTKQDDDTEVEISVNAPHPSSVRLHIYKLDAAQLESLVSFAGYFSNIKGTAYHTGMEVYDVEWYYGYSESRYGIAPTEPGYSHLGEHVEVHNMGQTPLNSEGVENVLRSMADEWLGPEYSLLDHNCTHFCEEFAKRLKVKLEMPEKVFELGQSADEALGGNWKELLFGDSKAKPEEPDPANAQEIYQRNLLAMEAFEDATGYMHEAVQDWEDDKQLGRLRRRLNFRDLDAYSPFKPGQIRHAPRALEFPVMLNHTIARLKRLQTTIKADRINSFL